MCEMGDGTAFWPTSGLLLIVSIDKDLRNNLTALANADWMVFCLVPARGCFGWRRAPGSMALCDKFARTISAWRHWGTLTVPEVLDTVLAR